MVFILDNYDSFTYNLVQYLENSAPRSRFAATTNLIVANLKMLCARSACLLSPGPCTPQEAGISIDLVRHFAGKVPVLGVCLGHQAIGAAFGGENRPRPHLMHGKTSQVNTMAKPFFKGLPSPMTATRYHSLIMEEKRPAGRIRSQCLATEPDGTRVIMGFRHQKFSGGRSAISPRERPDKRRQETNRKFPAALISRACHPDAVEPKSMNHEALVRSPAAWPRFIRRFAPFTALNTAWALFMDSPETRLQDQSPPQFLLQPANTRACLA